MQTYLYPPLPIIAHQSTTPIDFNDSKLEEKKQIKFSSNNLESYNQPFSKDELRAAIHKAHDSATSPDNIHYQMLKNLPEVALDTLCESSMTPGLLVTSLQLGLKLPSYQSPNRERIPLTLGTTDVLH